MSRKRPKKVTAPTAFAVVFGAIVVSISASIARILDLKGATHTITHESYSYTQARPETDRKLVTHTRTIPVKRYPGEIQVLRRDGARHVVIGIFNNELVPIPLTPAKFEALTKQHKAAAKERATGGKGKSA